MFDVRRTGAEIREARIRKNMTQNALADEMGVSFQAVSNWERGSSMPDISKLEDLSRILQVDLHRILGAEGETVDAVLKKAERGETLTCGELEAAAPLMEPETLARLAEQRAEQGPMELADCVALAPFLGRETVEALVETAVPESLILLDGLAPFVSQASLERLVDRTPGEEPAGWVEWETLSPFLSPEYRQKFWEWITKK